jgi:hypothetical protein
MTEPERDLDQVFSQVEKLELRTAGEVVEEEQVAQTLAYIRSMLRDDPTLAGEAVEGASDGGQDSSTGVLVALMEASGTNQRAILQLLHGQASMTAQQRERDGRVDRLAIAIEKLTDVVERMERRRRPVFYGDQRGEDGAPDR